MHKERDVPDILQIRGCCGGCEIEVGRSGFVHRPTLSTCMFFAWDLDNRDPLYVRLSVLAFISPVNGRVAFFLWRARSWCIRDAGSSGVGILKSLSVLAILGCRSDDWIGRGYLRYALFLVFSFWSMLYRGAASGQCFCFESGRHGAR